MIRDAEPGLRSSYEAALRGYLVAGGEAHLLDAYKIGRETLAAGLANLVALHAESLKGIIRSDIGREEMVGVVDRSAQFLEEAVAPFEMTVRGFQEAIEGLRQANEELRRSDELKDRFIAQMSHELRTPLNSVLGFSELLLEGTAGPLEERQTRYVTNVHDSGQHLLRLVNDLLDLAKVRAGRLEVQRERVGTGPAIEDALDKVRPLASAKGVRLSAEVDFDADVLADRMRLVQVLLNLLSNAIKFTPSDGDVVVKTMSVNGQMVISVIDSGVGIAREDQGRVFDDFVQLDAGQSLGRQGTGLGLALSKQLVELMGGRIGLRSELGHGSTFYVLVPIYRGPAEADDL